MNKNNSNPESKGASASTRRSFLSKIGIGTIVLGIIGEVGIFLRSLVPDVLYEPPKLFKIGRPEDFPEGLTYLDAERLFVIRENQTFHVVSAICTHLGCTVKQVQTGIASVTIGGQPSADYEFHCPCHGSKFKSDGTRYEGPAPKGLVWYDIELAGDDGQIMVNSSEEGKDKLFLTV